MIDAVYFDGLSTRRQAVTMLIHKRIVVMRGKGIHLNVRLSQLTISERLDHAPRIVYLPKGGFIEISDHRGFDSMLARYQYRDPWVVRWQQNWLLSLLALISLLAMLIAGYQWGLPWAADNIAQHLPASIEKKIGDAGLELVDGKYLQPSKLDAATQARLRRLFSEMKQPSGETTAYRIEFRKSNVGPNAFALPNGVIVMTDELVALAQDDRAVLGVLGHELGHVRRHHSTRRLLQALGVGVVVNLFVGDISSILTTVPTFLLDQHYSREFERESDQFAIEMMQANGIPLSPMADLFKKMQALHEDKPDAESQSHDDESRNNQTRRTKGRSQRNTAMDYLSSHPSNEERIARLLAADAK